MRNTLTLVSLLVVAVTSAQCSSEPQALRVGEERPLQSGAAAEPTWEQAPVDNPTDTVLGDGAADASAAPRWAELAVTIRDRSGPAPAELSACTGECLELEAAAEGGNPPYAYAWDDGSTAAVRRVCPETSTTVTVTVNDTAIEGAEFNYEAKRTMAAASVSARDCAMAAADAAAPAQVGSCALPDVAACDLGSGITLPEEVTVDVAGATLQYFANGAVLPAGRYRLEYVDGCNTYGVACDWTVHGSKNQPGLESCFMVANDTEILGLTPGTVGIFDSDDETLGGAFTNYEDCVAANCEQPPIDFDFAGGTLGVQRDGGGVLGAVDDAGGEMVGGRSPTFRLTRLDGCD